MYMRAHAYALVYTESYARDCVRGRVWVLARGRPAPPAGRKYPYTTTRAVPAQSWQAMFEYTNSSRLPAPRAVQQATSLGRGPPVSLTRGQLAAFAAALGGSASDGAGWPPPPLALLSPPRAARVVPVCAASAAPRPICLATYRRIQVHVDNYGARYSCIITQQDTLLKP